MKWWEHKYFSHVFFAFIVKPLLLILHLFPRFLCSNLGFFLHPYHACWSQDKPSWQSRVLLEMLYIHSSWRVFISSITLCMSSQFLFYLVFCPFFSHLRSAVPLQRRSCWIARIFLSGAVDEWTLIAWWKIRAKSLM